MQDTNIQWHPGFVAAMNLEFRTDRHNLVFETEYNLNTKPLAVDLLIIKKNPSVHISNEIGHFFRGHNIIEYKSPEDSLNIDTCYKAVAYASLYKSYGKTVNAIKADDVTISLIREGKPEGLFRYLNEHGYSITSPARGIYYIEHIFPFPTQIVVTGELNRKTHLWLMSLSGNLKQQDMQELIDNIRCLLQKEEKELAASVLEVSISANKQIVKNLLGGDIMHEVVMELLEPKLKELEKGWLQEGRQEGIRGTVDILLKLGLENTEIKTNIMEEYQLSEKEAESYF